MIGAKGVCGLKHGFQNKAGLGAACRSARPRVTRGVARRVASREDLGSTDERLKGLIDVLSAEDWNRNSWREKPVLQQPDYPCEQDVRKVHDQLCDLPPLVFAGECRNLSEKLAKCSRGEAFWLQGGDCAESFTEFSANHIRDTYRILLQMSVVMMFGGGIPVVLSLIHI